VVWPVRSCAVRTVAKRSSNSLSHGGHSAVEGAVAEPRAHGGNIAPSCARWLPVRTVIVPMGRRHLKIGTFRSICRQAGLQPTDF
jgi:hypothetical protein